MRKITEQSVKAFLNREYFNKGNMYADSTILQLHGNTIAKRTESDEIEISFAGWNTPTTKERLNGLADLLFNQRPFHTRDFELFANNLPIDSSDWYNLRELSCVGRCPNGV